MQITAEIDQAFDGQAKFIYGILNKSARINTVLGLDIDDLVQEFYFYYTKHRTKYNPERASRSKFTYWLVRSFLFSLRRKNGKGPQFLQKEADVFTSNCVLLDSGEQQLVDAVDHVGRLAIKTLAKRVGRSEIEVRKDVESIREKVLHKSNKIIVVRN